MLGPKGCHRSDVRADNTGGCQSEIRGEAVTLLQLQMGHGDNPCV